jgi:hypothetical protein
MPVLLGGDFNSHTYDLSTNFRFAGDLLHRFLVVGLDVAIPNYMTPELRFERPVFDVLTERGFTIEGFNDRTRGTRSFDADDPYTVEKARRAIGGLLTRFGLWLVRRRGGRFEARLDWFAGRGLQAKGAAVVDVRDEERRPVSDHAAITVDVELPHVDESA